MENIYHQYWEQELQYSFITEDRCKKRAYVCSPLSAETEKDFIENMRVARAYMFYALKKMNMSASAPHAYLPMLLCDKVPAERAIALDIGLRLLEQSEVLLVCGNRLSSGMKGEISRAVELRMDIIVFDEGLYLDVKKLVTQKGGEKGTVKLDRENFPMGFTSPTTYLENAAMFK